MEGNVKWQCEACIHPYKNLFHNIFGAVEFPDNTVYQFLLFLEEFPVRVKFYTKQESHISKSPRTIL